MPTPISNRSKWAQQHAQLEAVFASKTRDEWEAVFALTDACVTPVLDYSEAAAHPANAERSAVVQDGKWLHPQIAPRLSSQSLGRQLHDCVARWRLCRDTGRGGSGLCRGRKSGFRAARSLPAEPLTP